MARRGRRTAMEYAIAALNSDVMREIRLADDCIRRARELAQPYRRFQRQLARCAASAMRNATALAAEVLSMGGVPPAQVKQRSWKSPNWPTVEEYFADVQWLVKHYTKRLAMAESFGLPRLREVLQEVLASKRWHLRNAAPLACAAETPRQLS